MGKREKSQVYAIVRIDRYGLDRIGDDGAIPIEEIELAVAVKSIVSTLEEAPAEVERLQGINDSSKCVYYWRATRLIGSKPEIPPEPLG